MTTLLAENELLLLFVVILSGVALGRVAIAGVRLGLAGVLFAGLGLSAWLGAPAAPLKLAPELKELGLVLFVYCVGLLSGPGFFSAFRKHGLPLNAAVLAVLTGAAGLCVAGAHWLGLSPGLAAGVFCGSLTNTPALGAATDRVAGTADAMAPALGYSITYPFGVLGALVAFRVFVRLRSSELASELAQEKQAQAPLGNMTVRVTAAEVIGHCLGELRVRERLGILVSRVRRGDELIVPNQFTVMQAGDLLTLVGQGEALQHAIALFGESTREHLEAERGQVDMRRILVSHPDHVGRRLEELDLERRFGATVTRVRRADVDLLAEPHLRLSSGDRLRVVAPAARLAEVASYFGDSERELAALDYVGLGLGLALGLAIAEVPLPLFDTEVKLGAAGGPLLVALVAGALGRSGPIVWAIPHELNTALRDLGLLLFLAGVGVSAGGQLGSIAGAEGLKLLALGGAVTLLASVTLLWVADRWIRTPVVGTLGTCSGMHTQPATLAMAYELSQRAQGTYLSYALVFPVAMIAKIFLVQMILVFG